MRGTLPQKFQSIDEYIASAAPETRSILQEIRRRVRRLVPEAKEVISYQMPAFRGKRTFIYFAGFKQHIGIYPPVKGEASLNQALLPYRGEKGNLRFPLAEPIPYDLIERVIKALAKEHA